MSGFYFKKIETMKTEIKPNWLLTFENEFKVVQEKEFNDSLKIEFLQKRFDFLKSKVELKHFVPCGADGFPLEEPQLHDIQVAFDEWDADYDPKEVEAYKKALESVVFDGWEVVDLPQCYQVKNNKTEILFYKNEDSIYLINEKCFMLEIYSYSDIASQTIDNPLKLKQ